MGSTLIETININADDFTDNFLTCPTCMSAYDENEHTPKLLPCSHTLCRSCLERIAATATTAVVPAVNVAVTNGDHHHHASSTLVANNSIARSIAAADAAAAAMTIHSGTTISPSSSSSTSQLNESPRLNAINASARLSSSSLVSASNRNSGGGVTAASALPNWPGANQGQQPLIIDQCIRCPICRESIVLPRNGGVLSLPPSFIINQLLDLVKSKKSRDIIPRCLNHTSEELLFCETCDKSFCSICESHFKSASNADHIIVPFSIAIKRMAEIYLFKSNQCINSFNLALGNVQNEIVSLNRTVENVVQRVDESFDEAKRVLDKRRHELLRQLAKIKETKTALLNDQIKLIVNERQKVELECKQHQQANIESKLLSAQIQNINEKLDCLRTLCEPRENSFIDYEYKFNACLNEVDVVMQRFGRFKVSNTYPPLCTAKIIEDNQVVYPSSAASTTNGKENVFNSAANLSITLQVDTVDYYGNKRTDGGDPVTILVTDSSARQQYFKTSGGEVGEESESTGGIVDLNNGSYRFTFTPNVPGRYRVDINIFARAIYHMPIHIAASEFVDPLWTFGGGSSDRAGSGGSGATLSAGVTLMRNFSFHNKGATDRDFNMPISVRCLDKLIYILDSGNNRIKILNKSGQFVGNIKHDGLNESSATALAVHRKNGKEYLLTLNWRLKCLSKYELESKTVEKTLLSLDEPISLIETFHPELFLVQDNKKRLFLVTWSGRVVCESLETKVKLECGIKNIVSLCGNESDRRIYVAGVTTTNSASAIFEVGLDWLCDNKLDTIVDSLDGSTCSSSAPGLIAQPFTYPLGTQHKTLSSSLTSLASITSTATTLTTNSSGPVKPSAASACGGAGVGGSGVYTALWHDTRTQKLIAAKSDKHRTVIEVFNSATRLYEYSLVEAAAPAVVDRPLKKVTSICSTDDGKIVCVDLVQNFAKLFRFV